MKYNVTYSCSHKGQIELFGKSSERDSKLQWYQNTAVCPDCYKARKRAEREETNSELGQLKARVASYNKALVAKITEIGENAMVELARSQGMASGASEEMLRKSENNIRQVASDIRALALNTK